MWWSSHGDELIRLAEHIANRATSRLGEPFSKLEQRRLVVQFVSVDFSRGPKPIRTVLQPPIELISCAWRRDEVANQKHSLGLAAKHCRDGATNFLDQPDDVILGIQVQAAPGRKSFAIVLDDPRIRGERKPGEVFVPWLHDGWLVLEERDSSIGALNGCVPEWRSFGLDKQLGWSFSRDVDTYCSPAHIRLSDGNYVPSTVLDP
jgi:hypothetical protein